jgi:ribose 5-phosphate isomerase B
MTETNNKASTRQFDSIIFGSDHAGAFLKNALIEFARIQDIPFVDFGPADESVSADYPDVIPPVIHRVLQSPKACGVLVCGTGAGMGMGANRFCGIRAALCHTPLLAALVREHNDANVLVLGGRLTTPHVARMCLDTFLRTPFQGDRHLGRIHKLDGFHETGGA